MSSSTCFTISSLFLCDFGGEIVQTALCQHTDNWQQQCDSLCVCVCHHHAFFCLWIKRPSHWLYLCLCPTSQPSVSRTSRVNGLSRTAKPIRGAPSPGLRPPHTASISPPPQPLCGRNSRSLTVCSAKKGKGIACSISANHLPDPNVSSWYNSWCDHLFLYCGEYLCSRWSLLFYCPEHTVGRAVYTDKLRTLHFSLHAFSWWPVELPLCTSLLICATPWTCLHCSFSPSAWVGLTFSHRCSQDEYHMLPCLSLPWFLVVDFTSQMFSLFSLSIIWP